MRHDFLDRYSRLDSRVHRLPAGAKLLGAVALVSMLVVLPIAHARWFVGIALFLVATVVLARIPVGFVARRLLLLEPLVLGVAFLSLLQPQGPRIFTGIVVKSTLCLLTVIVLASTTPFAALLRVLRQLHVPAILVTTLALLYRYLFVLVDEAQRLQRARASRTFRGGRARLWRSLGATLGMLFVRSTERAERIYAAMCARGWR